MGGALRLPPPPPPRRPGRLVPELSRTHPGSEDSLRLKCLDDRTW